MNWRQVLLGIKNLTRRITLLSILTLFTVSHGYADTIIIDPGHGGPGADMWNNNNGDGRGTYGPNGLTEQWVNLEIANLLYTQMYDNGWTVDQTQLTQTQNVEPIQRANIANAHIK